jgi:hemerythrin superfamily protein
VSNGDGGVVDLLTRDHQVLRGLVARLDKEEDPARLTSLFDSFARKLAAHEAGEQQVVFPALRDAVESSDDAARRRADEHEEINELLAEMRVLTAYDRGFEKRAGALYVQLEAHFAAEEDDVFPRLRSSISQSGLMVLADRVKAVQEAAPPFPEPILMQHVHTERRARRV